MVSMGNRADRGAGASPGGKANIIGMGAIWGYLSAHHSLVPAETDPMTDTPPDRLSTNPDSPYYDEAVLERDVGIRFKGVEKTNVEEYCVSEGWVRVTAGAAKDRRGNPITIKLSGLVEPYFRKGE